MIWVRFKRSIVTNQPESLTERFLVALMTRDVPKNKNMKLEDVYKRFNAYGIHFNRGTRQEIEEYLLKLNILIRKSDSGEAQYVKSLL